MPQSGLAFCMAAICILAAGAAHSMDKPSPKCQQMGSELFENFVASQLHLLSDGSVFAGEGEGDTQAVFAKVPQKAQRLVEQTIREGKGWAAFGIKTNTENRLEVQVLYLLEDGDACVAIQEKPEQISTIYLPEAVSRSLLLYFRQPTYGDEVELRSRIQAFLTKTNENRPTSTAPRTLKGAKPRRIDAREYVRKWQETFPEPMLESLVRLQDVCNARNDGSKIELANNFVTSSDIDRDGDEDWIANGYGVLCSGPDGRRRVLAGDDNGATVWITTSDKGVPGPMAELRFSTGDTIWQYEGFVVVDSKMGIYPLKGGVVGNPLKSLPSGGKILFSLSRG